MLFQAWAHRAMRAASPVFAEGWSPARPLETPDGLADPAGMAGLLSDVAAEVVERYGRLDVAWGEVNRLQLGDHDLPANGAGSELGAFRVAATRPTDGPTQKVLGGDSWVAVVEFTQPPRARVLLSYGNATQPDSPHNGDQLQLFSEMKLREAWRTMDQLTGRITRTEILDFPD
ncbi:MAG: hypothetical protein HKN58_05280 [Xanthomonadales bacterium]|nr:hypothetical protein [Xanthomonadales bacterium]